MRCPLILLPQSNIAMVRIGVFLQTLVDCILGAVSLFGSVISSF